MGPHSQRQGCHTIRIIGACDHHQQARRVKCHAQGQKNWDKQSKGSNRQPSCYRTNSYLLSHAYPKIDVHDCIDPFLNFFRARSRAVVPNFFFPKDPVACVKEQPKSYWHAYVKLINHSFSELLKHEHSFFKPNSQCPKLNFRITDYFVQTLNPGQVLGTNFHNSSILFLKTLNIF